MDFQKNKIVKVTIEDIGSEGEGIGRVDGFTLFVKDAVVGDTVEARIVKNRKNFAFARLEKVLEPSPFRVEPKCAFHRQCGGCQLQALSYEKQLPFKQEKIRSSLIRIGGFAPEYVDERMEPAEGMEEPFRYRNKAQYPVGVDREGNVIAGFYAGRTHSIIANSSCLLGPAENEAILECILDHMRRNRVSAYDETTGTGLVRHILIRKGFSSGEIMVCLVINKKVTDMSCDGCERDPDAWDFDAGKPVGGNSDAGKLDAGDPDAGKPAGGKGRGGKPRGGTPKKSCGIRQMDADICVGTNACGSKAAEKDFLPGQEELVSRLARIKGMTSVSVSINTEQTNVIMGREIHTLWGRDSIQDTIRVRDMTKPGYPFTGAGLTFQISPLSFYQVNPMQTEKLYSLALEYAGLTGRETVWDLYCGIGTISLFLAGRARKVYGVEIVPQAIRDAKDNAERNGIANAEFFVGKAEEVMRRFYEDNASECRPDVVVVDPPRKGCDGECLSAILAVQPERIVYVSCDPATLARDLKILCGGGYEVMRMRGVDMFGMTVHVETVVLLSHKSPDKYY